MTSASGPGEEEAPPWPRVRIPATVVAVGALMCYEVCYEEIVN